MAKDSRAVMAVEDGGDNSDCSIEEIPPESYFKHRNGTEGRRFRDSQRSNSSSNASCRGWHGDVMQQYHPHVIGSNFTSNLYSFAWSQAVQNKPLGFTEMASATRPLDLDDDDDNKAKEKVGQDEDSRESNRISEKEEELEEGEIDDFESSELEFRGERRSDSSGETEDSRSSVDLLKEGDMKEEVASVSGDLPPSLPVIVRDEKEKEGDDIIFEDVPSLAVQIGNKEKADEMEEELENFDMRVIMLLEELENLSEETVEKSFEEACSRLWKALQNLQEMVAEGHLPVLDAVIQQAFVVVNTIYSVFLKGKEQHKDVLARFFMDIKRQEPKLFASEEMKEIDAMIKALGPDHSKIMSGDLLVEKPVNSSGRGGANDGHSFFKSRKLEPLNLSRNRLDFRPLLDPHANHDEGSLPSPTSGGVAPLPFREATLSRDGTATSQQSICRLGVSGGSTVLTYETDAVKAVCNYQQKYDRISYISNNQLPSPTPSEESNDDKGDSHGEVSSSHYVSTARTVPNFGMVNIANSGSTFDVGPGFHGYQSNGVIKASAKSRDPRLRNVNSNTGHSSYFNKQPIHSRSEEPSNGFPDNVLINSRKKKFSDGHLFYSQSLKKPRNDNLTLRDSSISSDRGGLLEINGFIPPTQTSENACALEFVESMKFDKQEKSFNSQETIIGGKPLQTVNIVQNASLPSLLKDIAVNPTMLLQILMEQQKLMAESPQETVNPVQGAPHSSSTNIPAASVSSSGITLKPPEPHVRPDGKAQSISHSAAMSSQSEPGKVRMKPRDPRRFLHNNLLQKVDNTGSEQLVSGCLSSITINSKDLKVVREQGERACAALPPDNVSNFTKKFVNSSDITSTKQPASVRPMVPQSSSQLVRENTDEVNAGQRSSAFTSEANMKVTSVSPSPWGDVGHLLDGYDDQQKAAIQRERARRIEEQSKMFAARKLCLVLDLDHTLLNSAKFSEVDPFHDLILKNKEEQDRDQQQRHLFRFQHMAMWTKLRPGVWNFLEKASKLFELHLYTMGNNLYAMEMAKVLDPKGTLFSGRVISKGDDGDSPDGDDRMPKSKDLEGVLGMESAVVIIDDSIKVWPHHKLNLIVVERYTYFPSSRRQFGLLGPSLLEIDHDERPEDGTLASSLAVIERVHQNFFSHSSLNNVDVRNILAAEQRKILGGCRIVFSRIFPVGEMNPHLHPLWQTAEQFGAVCTNQIDDQVTHVVANSLGTDKVNWALSTGRFVVHPGWVEASALLYRRANEHDFAVIKL